jgi:hypothetical protein
MQVFDKPFTDYLGGASHERHKKRVCSREMQIWSRSVTDLKVARQISTLSGR